MAENTKELMKRGMSEGQKKMFVITTSTSFIIFILLSAIFSFLAINELFTNELRTFWISFYFAVAIFFGLLSITSCIYFIPLNIFILKEEMEQLEG